MSTTNDNAGDGTKKDAHRRVEEGIVASAKMNKTLVVDVTRLKKHPKYGKYYREKVRFYVHDENNAATIGDRVRIEETRPLSKTKRWRLLAVLKHTEV
ncbi:MAG: 30S ribosomal protein S17 [Planctomycetes bacterium]|nr:30S ribosomal protein S17 [Planctomycetota bacterium]MCB9892453.1 30S ribosomal protein S17 [Planctomycetota bacterium]